MAKSFTYPFNVDNATDYKEVLKYLNDKIDTVKKKVSYFDFYNITSAVTDTENFAAQINSLPLNEALVVNTSPFYYSGENYSTGDIIIKNNTGGVYHIKAHTGGVYFPEKIEKLKNDPSNYALTYTFASSTPTNPYSQVEIGESAELAEKITFTGLNKNDPHKTNIYGEWGKLQLSNISAYNDKCLFTVKALNDPITANAYIRPFAQFFMCNDGGVPGETIYIDYELILDQSNFEDAHWVIIPNYNINETQNIYVKVK